LSPLKSIIQYNRFIIDNAKLTYPIIEGTYPFYTLKRKEVEIIKEGINGKILWMQLGLKSG